jgi:hypothetical protein
MNPPASCFDHEKGSFVMTHSTGRDPTEFFSVVGTAYVSEQHDDGRSHYIEQTLASERAGGVASLWLAFYGAIVGISLFAGSGAAKWINVAALLK